MEFIYVQPEIKNPKAKIYSNNILNTSTPKRKLIKSNLSSQTLIYSQIQQGSQLLVQKMYIYIYIYIQVQSGLGLIIAANQNFQNIYGIKLDLLLNSSINSLMLPALKKAHNKLVKDMIIQENNSYFNSIKQSCVLHNDGYAV